MQETTTLDVKTVRTNFPALTGEWSFLDNAGGTQVARQVLAKIADHLVTSNVQHGASYFVSQLAERRLDEARSRIALLLGARNKDEIIFGSSTSILLLLLSIALSARMVPGDEIIVTDFDHNANIAVWRILTNQGIVVRTWKVDPATGEIDLDGLAVLLSDRTRLVAVTHVSNILGTIYPVAEIARMVHACGAELCVDGVAFAPHRAVDVVELEVDYYLVSLYKIFGPHISVMYCREDRLAAMGDLPGAKPHSKGGPALLEIGNANYELAYGASGIIDYLESLSGRRGRVAVEAAFDCIATYEESLTAMLLEWLEAQPHVRIVGRRTARRAERVAIVSFTVDGRDPAQLVAATDKRFLAIRHGDFHSNRLIHAMGLAKSGGVVRVSAAHYNSEAEIQLLIQALDAATKA